MDQHERRQNERFAVYLPVFVRSDYGIGYCIIRNISKTGLFLESYLPCPFGANLQIIFHTQDYPVDMCLFGRVKHKYHLQYAEPSGKVSALVGVGVKYFFQGDEPKQVPLVESEITLH